MKGYKDAMEGYVLNGRKYYKWKNFFLGGGLSIKKYNSQPSI